jgi:hypothetical protein
MPVRISTEGCVEWHNGLARSISIKCATPSKYGASTTPSKYGASTTPNKRPEFGEGDCLEIASKGNSSAGCQTKIQRAGWVMLSVKVLLLWFVHSRLIGVSPLTRHPTHADNRRDPTRQGDVNDRGAAHLSHRSLCNLSPSPTQLQHR